MIVTKQQMQEAYTFARESASHCQDVQKQGTFAALENIYDQAAVGAAIAISLREAYRYDEMSVICGRLADIADGAA